MTKKTPIISAIAAIGQNTRVIGKGNNLLWHIPEDLKRFKTLTLGHPVIMGRKTFESIINILGKPLPQRINIIVTKNFNYPYNDEEVKVVHSIEEAINLASTLDSEEIFIIGGGEIYHQSLPILDRLYLTLVNSKKEGDTFFPAYQHIFNKKIFEETYDDYSLPFKWLTLEKNESK